MNTPKPNTECTTFICPRCLTEFTAEVHKGDDICRCEKDGCEEYALRVEEVA